jgi:hypothetical protein
MKNCPILQFFRYIIYNTQNLNVIQWTQAIYSGYLVEEKLKLALLSGLDGDSLTSADGSIFFLHYSRRAWHREIKSRGEVTREYFAIFDSSHYHFS